ncbi:DNA replication protein, partial [Escherichia coli]|nr:DNA replication protein [Escherichia coli]
LTSGNKKQTETGLTNPVNEQKRAAIYEARTKQAKAGFKNPVTD